MIRVVIADDQALVRAGFRSILDKSDGIDVIGEAADGRQAVQLARERRPDVVLMDIRMPVLDGIAATREVMAGDHGCRVLILTTFDLDEYVYDALRAGASGFLLKDAPPEHLEAAIHTVAAGESMLAPSITRRVIEEYVTRPRGGAVSDPRVATLTDRELDVLRALARGRSNTELAAELFLSESTVKTHVTRILAKLGLRDRLQAVVFAYEQGLASTQG